MFINTLLTPHPPLPRMPYSAFKHQYREIIVMLMRKAIVVCPKQARIDSAKVVGI